MKKDLLHSPRAMWERKAVAVEGMEKGEGTWALEHVQTGLSRSHSLVPRPITFVRAELKWQPLCNLRVAGGVR